jgi:hypothetical protein
MLAFVQPRPVIRPARSGEAALVSYLRHAALWCVDMPGRSPETIGAFLERVPDVDAALIEAGRYTVVERAGVILGGAGWSPLPTTDRAWLFGEAEEAGLGGEDAILVRGFFVDDEVRYATGLGLLARVEEEAACAGFRSAEIVAPAVLQDYHRAMGFRTVRRLQFSGGEETVPLVHMRKAFTLPRRACA